MNSSLHTSEIPLNSSLHGAQRRSQRDILKRDLQSAVKYGIKEHGHDSPSGEPRWKYTFADIVYITDSTSTIEVTSYAIEFPLEKKEISNRMTEQYQEAKRRISSNPKIITSHHVFIVDMSASMRESDLNGHKSRYRAVYYSLAEEFILPQMEILGAFTGTDVISLIEMRDDATILLELEPISWLLYNKFVELSERKKKDSAFQNGNYIPSIRTAFEILLAYDHERCTLSLFFLSDGRPSDSHTLFKGSRSSGELFMQVLLNIIEEPCLRFNTRMTIIACGYGSTDFGIMKSIIQKAIDCNVKNARFLETSIDPDALSSTMSSIISSTTEMRTMLSRLSFAKGDNNRVLSQAKKEVLPSNLLESTTNHFLMDKWRKYVNPPGEPILLSRREEGIKNCECYTINKFKRGCDTFYIKRNFQSPNASGIMVKKEYFGAGAERLVFEMFEIDINGNTVGQPLVAKESKYELREKQEKFHMSFLKTQQESAFLALKFNKALDSLNVDKMIPRIMFLECYVYLCDKGKIEFLCENKLNQDKYRKWNDNAGGVDGVNSNKNVIKQVQHIEEIDYSAGVHKNFTIAEGDSEEDNSDEDSSEDGDNNNDKKNTIPQCNPRIQSLQSSVLDSDVPQTFSHWTHVYTKRHKLVCDIQGELVSTPSGNVFLCTDPCIHRRLRKDGKSSKKYGRTNKASSGINEFFESHKCNALCEILKIDVKVKKTFN